MTFPPPIPSSGSRPSGTTRIVTCHEPAHRVDTCAVKPLGSRATMTFEIRASNGAVSALSTTALLKPSVANVTCTFNLSRVVVARA